MLLADDDDALVSSSQVPLVGPTSNQAIPASTTPSLLATMLEALQIFSPLGHDLRLPFDAQCVIPSNLFACFCEISCSISSFFIWTSSQVNALRNWAVMERSSLSCNSRGDFQCINMWKQTSLLGFHKTGASPTSIRFCRPLFMPRLLCYGQRRLSLRVNAVASMSETDSMVKKGGLSDEESLRLLMNEGEGGPDFATQVLKSIPSQVESRYLIDGQLYTLREREMLRVSPWKRLVSALKLENFGRVMKSKTEAPQQELIKPAQEGTDEDLVSQAKKSVYLSDLLREYKGELYVPEEAFVRSTSDLDDFQREIEVLPIMKGEDFVRAVKANQVNLVTSKAALGPGKFVYRDFIVNLNPIPGEGELHHTKWAMHLSEDEAEAVLKEYNGPQVEIETQYTPAVVVPPRNPNPVASSISGKVMLELAVASGLIATMAYTVGGFLAALVFAGVSAVTVGLAYMVPSVMTPLMWSARVIVVKLLEGIGTVLFGGFTQDTFGKRGFLGIISSIYGVFTSGDFTTSVRLLAIMIFVGGLMASIARFTLTRRPKDFTKWDLWQAIEFGQSKPQARIEGTTGVLFEDIAGIDEVVEELQELVHYLKNPERFNQMGTKPPHGVLLEGPPGCGKTLLAKAIAGEAGVPFYQMAGSEFVEVLVGVGAARVRDLFKRAKINHPSVVFIDEIDALGSMRQGADGGDMEEYNAGSQERETTLNQLLIELDGFDTGKGVIFLGATNRRDMLDPALLRPGRFDRKIKVKPPRAKGRLEILKVHAKSVKLAPEVDLWVVAKNLPGWTGAELAQLLQEGAMMAVRNGHPHIVQKDLDLAVDRITVGPQRFGVGRGLPVHRRMATLEVGLAMTTHILRRLEGAKLEYCERVSIVPRGETLSRTIFQRLDDEGYFFERRPQLLHRLQVFLGGRAAEEALYGRDTSNWSVSALRDASWLARKIVTIFNLEGPLTVRGEEPPWSSDVSFTGPPLNFEGWLYDDYGFTERTLNLEMDDEVAKYSEALMNRMYKKTLSMLQQHRAALTKAIYVILEKDELYGYELDLILDKYPADTPVRLVEEEADPAALPSFSEAKPGLEILLDARVG
ncbi:hypothetical protein GOP47_0021653 [Adiantum capillus-veneris]|uniref:AAA+ ATPase domain-containing protein n=1 Tax=Adiantum capillus-veneris TaxID=13818 RepID=A0A9D4UA05_ADICA|nr:hypothetical protein GOP47_0021653 [Adiantum capillus-veneris]